MQYLLSEEEMQGVRVREREMLDLPSRDVLVTAVQSIACNAIGLQPDMDWMAKREPSTRPHGCYHVRDDKGQRTSHYCDFCPVTKLCPQPKSWSK